MSFKNKIHKLQGYGELHLHITLRILGCHSSHQGQDLHPGEMVKRSMGTNDWNPREVAGTLEQRGDDEGSNPRRRAEVWCWKSKGLS